MQNDTIFFSIKYNDYTRIATLMNENPDFRNDIQKMINEAK
jgi:hypothetical protein